MYIDFVVILSKAGGKECNSCAHLGEAKVKDYKKFVNSRI